MLQHKRDDETMMNLIIQIAQQYSGIRSVILNGSRTITSSQTDPFQDYDIIYIVNDVQPFVEHAEWLNQFGDILIMEKPDEINGDWPKFKDHFAYLMLFRDGNRIDLTLVTPEKYNKMPPDSRSVLLLDKDGTVGELGPPSDQDYLPKSPSQKAFTDCCTEFLWLATYAAKGLWRRDIIYAKYMLETIIRPQLIQLLLWHVAIQTNFQKNMGKFGQHLQYYMNQSLWEQLLKTYADADIDNMWDALFTMYKIFSQVAPQIAAYFHYPFHEQQSHDVWNYLNDVRYDRL